MTANFDSELAEEVVLFRAYCSGKEAGGESNPRENSLARPTGSVLGPLVQIFDSKRLLDCTNSEKRKRCRSILSIPVLGNLAVLNSKHVKAKRLIVLSVRARPCLVYIDHNHIVFANRI